MANCEGSGSKWDKNGSRFGRLVRCQANSELYDMVGNVFEWTENYHHDNYNGAPTSMRRGLPMAIAQTALSVAVPGTSLPTSSHSAFHPWDSADLREHTNGLPRCPDAGYALRPLPKEVEIASVERTAPHVTGGEANA